MAAIPVVDCTSLSRYTSHPCDRLHWSNVTSVFTIRTDEQTGHILLCRNGATAPNQAEFHRYLDKALDPSQHMSKRCRGPSCCDRVVVGRFKNVARLLVVLQHLDCCRPCLLTWCHKCVKQHCSYSAEHAAVRPEVPSYLCHSNTKKVHQIDVKSSQALLKAFDSLGESVCPLCRKMLRRKDGK